MHCKDTILRTQNNWPYSKLIPNSGIDDIRQVSAYARDEKIISHLSDAQPYMGEYPCLIIYPEKQASDDLEVTRFNHEESLLQKARKINGFRNFYKMGVRLPVKI